MPLNVLGTPPRNVDARAQGAMLVMRMFRVARSVHPGWSARALWRSADLFARQLAWVGMLRTWFTHRHSALGEVISRRPSLVAAVNRPYISCRWGTAQRLSTIENHYRQLTGRAAVLRLAGGAPRELAQVQARETAIRVVIESPAWFAHEGEATLSLFDRGERLYSLVFSLGTVQGRTVAYVGALQGLRSEDALSIYRGLTHGLHGLRPRDLLLAAFRILCAQVGVERIFAVGDEVRVSQSAYFLDTLTVHSSYDDAWQEHQGQAQEDGFYELPLALPRRAPEAIPARKRGEYRKRYEMLDRLETEVAAAVAQGTEARAPR